MRFSALCSALIFGLCILTLHPVYGTEPELSANERAALEYLGPWPMAKTADPSNRASGNERAIALGERLFSDRRLSSQKHLSCLDCHHAENQFADAIALNVGLKPLTRHTLSLQNIRWQTWFGWSGGSDSLWMQSIRPILDASEMNMDPDILAKRILSDAALSQEIETVFDQKLQDRNPEQILAMIGKLLAAYQETLITAPSAFDRFRDAALAGDEAGIAAYPTSAIRGFKLFAGKGACTLCHLGPLLTSGEFGDIGITQFTGVGAVDQGRYAGIQSLLESPFNLLGAYNDDPQSASGLRTRHVKLQHRNFGEFRIPSLRNVSKTAPYMHNGSVATLEDVVDFYSELDEERLHADGEKILRSLNLTAAEKADLVRFLQTL